MGSLSYGCRGPLSPRIPGGTLFSDTGGQFEPDFPAGTRSEAVGFSINNRGFVLTGKSGTYQYDDMWEFFPTEEYDEND